MAKKIVRGITDVKTINNQDYDTNNVNDLLSDGQYNYIHRKKGENEEYHNLTDNIKTISSDNTDLLTVTNNNKTTNTALLSPKHDKQKEQVLESTRNTVTINHGTNGTAEKTTVDTNPEKVLEHDNLKTSYGISKTTSGNNTTLGIEYTRVNDGFNLNNLENGKVKGRDFLNAPSRGWLCVSSYMEGNYCIQRAFTLEDSNNKLWVRRMRGGTWREWREQVGDKSVIDGLLAQKQDKLTPGTGITIDGQTISYSGASVSIQDFAGEGFNAWKHVVTSGGKTLVTFSFQCNQAETVITGALKQQLENFIPLSATVSNGALSITRDGADIKLLNNAPSENVTQHATFTFTIYPV